MNFKIGPINAIRTSSGRSAVRTAVEWESELSRLAAVTVALELITAALVVTSSANGGGVSIAQELGERLWGETERGRWGRKIN